MGGLLTAEVYRREGCAILPSRFLPPGGIMTASLQKFPNNRKIDPDHERSIQCPYCSQKYLLVWDDQEWNSVKDWIRVAETAVRRSHRQHGDIELVPRLKVRPKS